MNTRIAFVFIILVVVLVTLGMWVGAQFAVRSAEGPSSYSAVYLTTGDIYYGKLSWFPWPHLTRVLLLQRNVDAQNQVGFRIVPLTDAFWKPVSELYLNPKQVVFWTRLQNSSDVACLVENFENPERCNREVPPPGAPTLPSPLPSAPTDEQTNPLPQ